MTSRRFRFRLVLAAALAGAAAGCASAPKPSVTTVTVAASPDSNPDAGGRPSPVVVRVYQLKNDAAFNGAEFFALFDDDTKVLGEQLISRAEYVVAPSEKRTIELSVSPEARFVGAIAAFRDIGSSQWRAAAPVTPDDERLTVGVERARIVLTVAD
jgi:type VI secretion system protein VasD